MPWDPEWSDGPGGHATSGSASVDQGYDDKNGDMMDEEETNGHNDNHQLQQNVQVNYVGDSQAEEESRWEPEDPMDLDDELPQAHQHVDPTPDRNVDVTPRPKQKVVGLAVPRAAQVQVVLHSSRKKTAYTVVPDELSADELVTSDLLPGLRPQSFYNTSQPLKPRLLNGNGPLASNTTEPADDTPQPKKRGRPKGWRLGQGPYSTSTPGSKVKKPPGRLPGSGKPGRPPGKFKPDGELRGKPGRKPAPTALQLYRQLNPRFPVFLCEWEGCPAQLHNLETLRRHFLIVHGQPLISPPSSSSSSISAGEHSDDGLIVCKWSTCLSSPTPRFEDDFRAHVEEAHMIPFAWHCGDGPQNTSANPQPPEITPKLPRYLFDSEGCQVTPSVEDQQVETEDDRKRRVARINTLIETRDENAPDEPEYDYEQMVILTRALNEKKKRQKGLRDYADYVMGIDGVVVLSEEEREERKRWRGQLR